MRHRGSPHFAVTGYSVLRTRSVDRACNGVAVTRPTSKRRRIPAHGRFRHLGTSDDKTEAQYDLSCKLHGWRTPDSRIHTGKSIEAGCVSSKVSRPIFSRHAEIFLKSLDGGPSPMGQVFLDLYHRRIPALIAAVTTGSTCAMSSLPRWSPRRRRDAARATSSQAAGTPCASWPNSPGRRPVSQRPVSGSRCGSPGYGHHARSSWMDVAAAGRSTRRRPSASWPTVIGGYPAPGRGRNSGSTHALSRKRSRTRIAGPTNTA